MSEAWDDSFPVSMKSQLQVILDKDAGPCDQTGSGQHIWEEESPEWPRRYWCRQCGHDSEMDAWQLITWDEVTTKELKALLESQRLAIVHCDEEPAPPLQVCGCLMHLAQWWSQKRVEHDELLNIDDPFPLISIVEILMEATAHLLSDHSCDALGHEGRAIAVAKARLWLSKMKRHAQT